MTLITAGAPDRGLVPLSAEESSRLVDAIESQLHTLPGVVVTRLNLDEPAKAPASMSDSGYVRVAAFSVGSTKSLPLIKIYVLEKKGDRTAAVCVDSQGGWPLGVPFDDSVIDAVKRAFAEVLPGYDVIVERSAGVDLR